MSDPAQTTSGAETPDIEAVNNLRRDSHNNSFWHSVPFQVCVACGVSFTAVGMWDAINGLGAGGAAEPFAVSAANAILYALFTVTCVIAGVVNNRIGLKYGLAIGAIGYPLYGAGLYTNNYSANTWFLLFGSAVCGISAGFFYAAEASIIIGYPSPHQRAFYLAIWSTAKAAGPIVGGAINLGTNVNRNFSGTISSTTYIIFIVLMCLGVPISLCLSSEKKVWRKDKTLIVISKGESWSQEFKSMFKLLLTRQILLVVPSFFVSYFFLGIQSTWMTTYFTVRSRALSSFLTYFAGIFSSYLLAFLLDRQRIPLKTRARIGFLAVICVMSGSWVWAIILQNRFYNMEEAPVFDWSDSGFPSAYLLSFFWYFGGQGFQQYLYWLVGQYSVDLRSLSHHTGILRGIEALGQTIAWAMQAREVNNFVSIGINFGLTLFCIVPAWTVISRLEHTHEVQIVEGQVTGKADELQNEDIGGKDGP